MKKSTLSILILSSLLIAEAKADGFSGDDEPAPLLAEFCEISLDEPDLILRCQNSKASSEHLHNCELFPEEFYKDIQTGEMFVSCLEADKDHTHPCGLMAWSNLERAECLKIVKDSDVSQSTLDGCTDFPKRKEMECLRTVTKLGLNVEKCEGWVPSKKMACLDILKAQKQQQ